MECRRALLMGNEAIAFGSLAAGVSVASAYPGTPSSEIVETLLKFRGDDLYVEWSSNEKVAFEVAYGAALSGARALTAMKHVGLNVAADPLMSSAYTGVRGSLVVVSADDPGMHSSQNEQDNRYYGLHAYIPVLEPSNPQEAHDVTIEAFELSERWGHPVILRTTTRVSHTRGVVCVRPRRHGVRGSFERSKLYVLLPSNARIARVEMLKRWEAIRRDLNGWRFNWVEGDESSDVLIVASGIAFSYVKEVVRELGARVRILKLSSTVPVPKDLVLKSLEGVSRALVVEELEPIVERQIKEVAYDEGLRVEVKGKEYVPLIGELTFDNVFDGVKRFLERGPPLYDKVSGRALDARAETPKLDVSPPPRPPALCPGCPHRALFYALKRAIAGSDVVAVTGDIGCYSLAYYPPYQLQDTIVEMGGSVGLACGIARVTGRPVVATIGDSTFFHAGLPGLADAVYYSAPVLLVVLDNLTVAMTGGQESFSEKLSVEAVARGLGVEYVAVFDPFELNEATKVIKDSLNYVSKTRKPAVIASRRPCTLKALRESTWKAARVAVDLNKCTGCGLCYDGFACPALVSRDDRKASIDPSLCVNCGVCAQVCPVGAIRLEGP